MKNKFRIVVSPFQRIILSPSKDVSLTCFDKLSMISAMISMICGATPSLLHAATTPSPVSAADLQVEIKGQFRGRLPVKRVVAPITLNLEQLQNFPEDRTQKIASEGLPLSQSADFQGFAEVKGHEPFWPWIPGLPEPPFAVLAAPEKARTKSWVFQMLNPAGTPIYREEGKGQAPRTFAWNGKDSEKKFAIVDRLYTPQLVYRDAEGRPGIVQGKAVVLPFLLYPSGETQTAEVSLARLFVSGRADFSHEGALLLGKISEWLRERGLTKVHIRISQPESGLAAEREQALAAALRKALHLSEAQASHDRNIKPSLRGEIAVLWAKKGGQP